MCRDEERQWRAKNMEQRVLDDVRVLWLAKHTTNFMWLSACFSKA